MITAGKQFVRHVLPAVLKPARVLWNELIGFIFLAFGVMVSFSTWRNYDDGGQAAGNPLVLLAGGGFAAMSASISAGPRSGALRRLRGPECHLALSDYLSRERTPGSLASN